MADTAPKREMIAVLDFGSQYAHLIAKRLRMLGYWSEIKSPAADCSELSNAKGIIFSGGPASVYENGGSLHKGAPDFNRKILDIDVPILGLCYGHHLMAQCYGGKVEKAAKAEFGFARFIPSQAGHSSPLLAGVEEGQVWMSHGDEVTAIPDGFAVIGKTNDCAFCALECAAKKRYSLQFHCEVKDTLCGNKILQNFASICSMPQNWSEDAAMQRIIEEIKRMAAGKKADGEHHTSAAPKVLLFLSGGVDSTVSFALLNKALGQDRVLGLHIDNGFMRKGESAAVASSYHAHGMNNFLTMDASGEFLDAIAGLTDPQAKRQAVGETFVKVRDEFVAKASGGCGGSDVSSPSTDSNPEKMLFPKGDGGEAKDWMLAQGTLYPDIIESGGSANSRTIKTHHNRVKGIQKLIEAGMVIEPLRDLYKDEVRRLGRKLGLDESMVMRHPFPGPGLSINVLCSDGESSDADKKEMASAQKELDNAVLDMFCENCRAHLERSVLPVRSVGVQGDYRTYRFPAVLTFAEQGGGFRHLPKKWEKLEAASNAITNKAEHINRTVLCLYLSLAEGGQNKTMRLQKAYCTRNNLDQLREADAIMLDALHASGWYGKVFQHLTIRLPYASAEGRASFVLRPVVSEDVMTARFAPLPQELLLGVVEKIAELPFTDAVYFDITGKPPATFGWE